MLYFSILIINIMVLIKNIGLYFIMLKRTFTKPQNKKVFLANISEELENMGIKSIGIVCFISLFVGAVISIQMAYNLYNPLIPKYYIGLATRQSVILEFSPTFIAIILAGKVGSYICSTIGSMRISEQIDALEAMGINSLNYLVLPKIICSLFFYPLLVMGSMIISIFGGLMASLFVGTCSKTDFLEGLLLNFIPFQVLYAIIKTVIFSFIISTVPCFFGYYVKGGALDVGKTSTKSVVWTIILIVLCNYFLTQLLLA